MTAWFFTSLASEEISYASCVCDFPMGTECCLFPARATHGRFIVPGRKNVISAYNDSLLRVQGQENEMFAATRLR